MGKINNSVGGGSGCIPTSIEEKPDLVGVESGLFPTKKEENRIWSEWKVDFSRLKKRKAGFGRSGKWTFSD